MKSRRKTSAEIKHLKLVLNELVIAWVAMGLTRKEIARNLKRSLKAVDWRWGFIKQNYGFRCDQDATRYAIQKKLIPLQIRYD